MRIDAHVARTRERLVAVLAYDRDHQVTVELTPDRAATLVDQLTHALGLLDDKCSVASCSAHPIDAAHGMCVDHD